MKKAVYIALTALLLSACANNAQTDKVDTSEISKAVSATTTTVTSASTVITSAEEKEITTSGTTVTSQSETRARKTESKSSSTKRTTAADREKETAASQTGASISDKTEPSITASVSVSESKPVVTTISSAAHKPVTQSSTTAKPSSETTKKSSTVTTTAKPKPKKTTTTTTTTTNTEEVEYVEIEDVTCLKTMVENLEETDTPPKYYEKIGKSLKHDGTDYGKAAAVYKWMRANGWGSCVYYSMETYFVCKGIGLECAYAFATKNDWYGHTYNVVKVNGTWYVLDTQGRSFLENSEYCTRMFDGNDNNLTPFKDDIWYDYDENGKYRNWAISD